MEYRVLGKLEVIRDGQPVDLGAFRQRALLALLLTAPNAVFSTDRILDELWGDAGGVDKQNALWVYVSGLRKALEPDREKRTEGSVLLTRAPGYLIAIDVDDVDARRFERLVGEGRSLTAIDPAAASLVLGEALALWRGRAFEDFTYESFAATEIARLEELRLEAVELRIDADLARGMSRELISELESLVRQHPLNERVAGQLMVALARSSRQAEALRAYQLLRSRLGEELGVEPSPSLRKLEQQILTGDESLHIGVPHSGSGGAPAVGPAVRGYELRELIDAKAGAYRAYQPAVGREVSLKVIRADRADDPAFIRRFQSEAQVIATLEHPHIVPLYDYWREPGAAYVVTRWMKGGTLDALLDHGPLTVAQTVRIIEQVGSALQTAHSLGVAHGEVAPAHVLLDDDGNAFLSDFGIAAGDGRITADRDIDQFGSLVAQLLSGRRDDINEIRPGLPPEIVDVVDRATDVDAAARYGSIGELLADLSRALRENVNLNRASSVLGHTVNVDNPYKGLRAFDATDAADFFGRERLVERLIARLGLSGTRGRFIAVVGPSGSGKSSAVKAGLLPAIRGGALAMSGSWFTLEMTPAPHPFEELENALLGVAVDPPASLLEQLAGENGLKRSIDRVLPNDGSQLLLVIDQFEELFTQMEPDVANRFLDNLVSAVNDSQTRIRVVVTLRADFYDRPLQHRGAGELLRDGTEVITPMTPQELESAITRPVEQTGITFEPALVAGLVREVTDRPGALPLLQYTLTELFDHRRDDRIDHDTYEEIGGVSGALVKRAEGLLASLGEQSHEVARQAFLRLVTFNDGGEDTRRRVLQSELEELDVDRLLLRSVLDAFGRHRLLSFDRDPITRSPTVEISHEALLTEWTRLRGWIDSARDDIRVQRRLAEAMRDWTAAGRADSYLLRGGLLDQVHAWATTTSLQLSAPERAFLDASVAERDRETAEAQMRESRAALAERRQRQRGRQLVAVAVAATLVAAIGAFGVVQWRNSLDAQGELDDLLVVSRLVTDSGAKLDDDPQLALLLAMESVRQTVDRGYATGDAIDAVHFALQELGVQYDIGHDAPVAARAGSEGPVGVFALSPHELMRMAESTAERPLTERECEEFLGGACADVAVPENLQLRGGMEAYADAGSNPLEGTTVTVCLCNNIYLDGGFADELTEFTERTGIRIELTGLEATTAVSFEPGELHLLPDVYLFAHAIPAWAHERAIDIAGFVDRETLRSDYGDYLLSFGTSGGVGSGPASDGSIRAIPMRVDPKGLVFYQKAVFEAAGYEIPDSWEALRALSDQMLEDGRTPWCFGFEAAGADGWPGTDFLESLVLRIGGVDVYDAWIRGEVGFTSPEVMEAGRLADELISAPGYVRRDKAGISDELWESQLNYMLARDSVTDQPEPECLMHHQASFMLGQIPADEVGTSIDVFPLPPIEAGQPTSMVGQAHFMSALTDRPEVRAFMEFVASPEWGRHWAANSEDHFIAPNSRFDVSSFGDPDADPGIGVQVRLAEATKAVLQANAFSFDASDLMPPEIGGSTLDGGLGAFWRAMIDWVDGVRTIEQGFADIDAEWAALRADQRQAAGP